MTATVVVVFCFKSMTSVGVNIGKPWTTVNVAFWRAGPTRQYGFIHIHRDSHVPNASLLSRFSIANVSHVFIVALRSRWKIAPRRTTNMSHTPRLNLMYTVVTVTGLKPARICLLNIVPGQNDAGTNNIYTTTFIIIESIQFVQSLYSVYRKFSFNPHFTS